MNKKIKFFLIAFILFPATSYCLDLYVNSIKAPLFREPSIGSEKIMEIKKGEKVGSISEKANWINVTYKEHTGWIYKMMVKKTKPIDRKEITADQVAELSEKARRRPSSFATTAAARGLKEKRKRFSDKFILDYDALEKMESIDVSDEDAKLFIERGVSNE